MTISSDTLNRRSLLISGVVVLTTSHTTILAGHADHTPRISVDTELLQPATEPATLDVEKDYSTETTEPPPPTEYCDLTLFPVVPASAVALSGVLQNDNLDNVPNMVLVQEFRYTSVAEAALDYDHVLGEVHGLAAHKYYLPDPKFLTSVHATEYQDLVTHTTSNGATFALLIRVEEDRVLVLRAGAKESDPSGALEALLTGILGSKVTTPATGENATGNTDWEVEPWRWNYGPIDIHPTRYGSPICKQ